MSRPAGQAGSPTGAVLACSAAGRRLPDGRRTE